MVKTIKKRGFTLIELLLYVSISALMLLAISVFLGALIEARVKNQTIAEVEQQGLQAMQALTQSIRNAAVVNFPLPGASSGSISVNMVTGSNPVVFDEGDGAIRVSEGGGPVVPLTNGRIIASNLTFQNLSGDSIHQSIRVSFTLTHLDPADRSEYGFTKTYISSASLREP